MTRHAMPGPNHPGAVGAPPAKLTPPAPEVPPELAGRPLKGWCVCGRAESGGGRRGVE
jgi:hypothetical protein